MPASTDPWLRELKFTDCGGHECPNSPLKGRAVSIWGGGPGMTPAIAAALDPYPHILTNNAYLLSRTPALLLSLDRRWFHWHGAALRHLGHVIVASPSPGHGIEYTGEWHCMVREREEPYHEDRWVLSGANSGHSAVGLAMTLGATRIYLAGFDMAFPGGRSHWHKDHPIPPQESSYTGKWRKDLETLVAYAKTVGVVIAAVTPTAAAIPTTHIAHALTDLAHDQDRVDHAPS